jgi:anti-sigma factor RsiW
MNSEMEVRLMRLLHGELPESQARGLRERMAREPELAAAYARLARTWEALELPDPAPAPVGFAARVAARARREAHARARLSWGLAPPWVRTAAAAALAVGVVLGAGLSLRTLGEDASANPPGIVDSYLALVSDSAVPAPTSMPGGEARP